jgi:hypothetical protein
MGKPTYLVYVVHRGRGDDYHRYRCFGGDINSSGAMLTENMFGFMEAIRASNRR